MEKTILIKKIMDHAREDILFASVGGCFEALQHFNHVRDGLIRRVDLMEVIVRHLFDVVAGGSTLCCLSVARFKSR